MAILCPIDVFAISKPFLPYKGVGRTDSNHNGLSNPRLSHK